MSLTKQFVKAFNKEGDCVGYIYRAFPGLNEEKWKAAIFNGRQMRKLVREKKFVLSMNEVQVAAWNIFAD